jgi:hypothetical protein
MIYLLEIDAYDPALPGTRTLRYSSGAGYGTGYTTARAAIAAGAGSATQVLDPLVTFTRASSATRTNESGTMETVGANVPRFDYQVTGTTTNLLLHSVGLSSWGTSQATRTLNAATAPDGQESASRFVATGTSNTSPGINSGTGVTAGLPYTFTVHYKRESGSDWVRLRIDAGGTIRSVWFNAATGAQGTVETPSGNVAALSAVAPVSLGNGWWRFGCTVTFTATSVNFAVAPATANGSATMVVGDTWLMWGAQLEQATSAGPFIGTTTEPATVSTTEPLGLLVEEARANVVTRSQDFSTGTAGAWLKYHTAHGHSADWNNYIINDPAVVCPDGSYTAVTISYIANGLILRKNSTFVIGTQYAVSCYVYYPSGSSFTITCNNDTTTVSTTITAAPRWQRVVWPPITPAGSSTFMDIEANLPAACSFWGFQVEATTTGVPTSYIPNLPTFTGRTSVGTWFDASGVMQTAAAGVARYGYAYGAAGWASTGLMLEAAATNRLLQSNGFGVAPWSAGAGGAVTVGVGSVAAPDGTLAATLEDTSTASIAGRGQSIAITSSTAIYTGSVYLRAGSSSIASLRMAISGGGTAVPAELVVNLATGAAVWRSGNVGAAFAVTPAGNGWYRVAVSAYDNGTGNTALGVEIRPAFALAYPATSFDSAATGSVHVFGAQVEQGTLSSYIPTAGATVARSADTFSTASATRAAETVTIPTLAPWFNPAQGTLLTEYVASTVKPAGVQVAAQFNDGTQTNRIAHFAVNSIGLIATNIDAGGVGQFGYTGGAPVAGTVYRHATAWTNNDFIAARNGALGSADTSGTVPAVTQLFIGHRANDQLNGWFRKLRYWGARLPDADVQTTSAGGAVSAAPALDLDFLTYATTTVAITNGTYDLYVEGAGGAEWRSVTVSGGSHTITPPPGSLSVTAYAFYPPGEAEPAAAYYDGRIVEPGNFQRAVFAPGTTGGESTVGAGEIILANPDGGLDGLLDYGLDGRPVRISTIPNESAAASSAARWATATAQQVEVSWNRVTIRLRDRLEMLRVPLQSTVYAGTTTSGGLNSAEGQPEDLRDRPKPLLYGEVYNVPAVLANAFDLIYQLHDGALASIDAVYDAGVPLLFSANYASITALRTATIQGGNYATCLSAGLFRIGASPFGAITADATEGATAADRTAAQVARRIITRSALTTGDLDLASFTALDGDNSAPVGIWFPDPVTALEASNTVLSSVGGWLLPNRLGVFEVGRLEAPAAPVASTFTEDEVLERGGGIERIASGDRGAGVPVWRVTVRYRRHYAVQGATEVAGCVASARRAELAQEWRSVKAENSAVKTKHLLATELSVDTCLADSADAQAEAERLLALYSVRRDRLIVPVDTDLAAAVDLGRTVSIQVGRWGYSGGRLMTVLGLAEQAAAGVSEIEVWG